MTFKITVLNQQNGKEKTHLIQMPVSKDYVLVVTNNIAASIIRTAAATIGKKKRHTLIPTKKSSKGQVLKRNRKQITVDEAIVEKSKK